MASGLCAALRVRLVVISGIRTGQQIGQFGGSQLTQTHGRLQKTGQSLSGHRKSGAEAAFIPSI